MSRKKTTGTTIDKTHKKVSEKFKHPNTVNNSLKKNQVLLIGNKGKVNAPLISKVFPSRMGDHSPSISTLNKSTDERGVFVSDRKTSNSKIKNKKQISEKEIFTHHALFKHKNLQTDYTKEEVSLGKLHHTVLTSLRKKGGVGEQEIFDDFDELLDKTLFAYYLGETKNYPDIKEPFRSYVRKANQDKNITQENHGNVFRHSVAPFVAQSFINIDLRAKADGKANPFLIVRSPIA